MLSGTTKGVEFYASEIEDFHSEKIEWKGVKQINNIEYIGDETKQSVEESTKIISSTNAGIPWVDDSKKSMIDYTDSDDSKATDVEDENNDQSNSTDTLDDQLFECLVDACVASYRYHAHLLRHYTIGKHKLKLEKYSLIDKSRLIFHQKLTTNYSHSTPLLSITVIPAANNSTIPALPEIWALQNAKPNVRFSDKQKQFLQEKFNQGVETGMKWDPARVALEMETLTSNGSYLFTNDECLTQGQIKSYFSRLVVKQRTTKQTSSRNTSSSSSISTTK
ncbi:unnamed protein product [Adineta ricciae]|uniref:C2H2-type domain-containing protein n=1 Tax=Adineta ricciae TaxID=249248 RepID=A0A815RXA0_ADIRI|nr:unnamed protein product [Adineta ricciae]